jgi:hypothetical protein
LQVSNTFELYHGSILPSRKDLSNLSLLFAALAVNLDNSGFVYQFAQKISAAEGSAALKFVYISSSVR